MFTISNPLETSHNFGLENKRRAKTRVWDAEDKGQLASISEVFRSFMNYAWRTFVWLWLLIYFYLGHAYPWNP